MPSRVRALGLVVAAAACALLALVLATSLLTEDAVTALNNVVQLAVPVLVAVPCCVAAARHCGWADRGRPWLLLGAGCASWAVGQAIFLWYEVVLHEEPFPSLGDLFFLLAVPLLVAGVAGQSTGLLRMGRLRVVLDGAIVATALLFAATGTFLTPIWEAGEGTAFERALLVAYPASDVLIVAVAIAVAARRAVGLRGPLGLVIAGVCSLAVADCAFAWFTSQGQQADPLTDLGWPLGFLLIAHGAHRTIQRNERADPARSTRGLEVWLPQVPVAIAAAVLGVRAVGGDPISPFLGGTGAVLIVLVILRQGIVQLENAELNHDLEGTVEELREREDELEYRALHDHLTGLANRALFRDRLHHTLARRAVDEVTVLFIDLDDFKTVNDTMGHDAGDRLLVLLAERLRACVRGGDTVARLGGDEFAVLLDEGGAEESTALGQRILEALEVPFGVSGRELRVRASIGVVAAPAGSTTAEQLLQDADMAMYAAKDAGGSRVESFAPPMRRDAADRLTLLTDLEGVLQRGELALLHQPSVRLADGRVAGHEALLRWRHPERGLLAPPEFMGLAEEVGLARSIGWWVLEESCRQLATRPGDRWVSVNVTVDLLRDPAAADRLLGILTRTGVEARRVVLEITERAIAQGPEVIEAMRRVRGLGLRLAMDDFGTGYSSLASLAGLPLDAIKIDGSFVARLDTIEGEVLVRAVVDLARALGLRSVAEGVEHPWQLERLLEIGCDGAQGYLLGHPADVPADRPAVPIGTARVEP